MPPDRLPALPRVVYVDERAVSDTFHVPTAAAARLLRRTATAAGCEQESGDRWIVYRSRSPRVTAALEGAGYRVERTGNGEKVSSTSTAPAVFAVGDVVIVPDDYCPGCDGRLNGVTGLVTGTVTDPHWKLADEHSGPYYTVLVDHRHSADGNLVYAAGELLGVAPSEVAEPS